MKICEKCDGNGKWLGLNAYHECDACEGSGHIHEEKLEKKSTTADDSDSFVRKKGIRWVPIGFEVKRAGALIDDEGNEVLDTEPCDLPYVVDVGKIDPALVETYLKNIESYYNRIVNQACTGQFEAEYNRISFVERDIRYLKISPYSCRICNI